MRLPCFKSPTVDAALLRVLVLAAVAILLFFAWREVSFGDVRAAVALWAWYHWLILAVANLAILAAMCWRWALILQRMGHPVGFGALVRYRMAANALSYITPGPQFGGEPLQVLYLTTHHQVPGPAASASVAVDRLTEMMGNLMLLSLAGLLVLPPLMEGRSALLAAAAFMLGAVLAAGLLLCGVARGRAPFSRAAVRAAQWTGRTARAAGLVAFLRSGERWAADILTGRLAGWYALIGLGQWSAFLVELWLIYAFLGFPMTAHALLTAAVAARLAFLLPLPGGLGALEAGQVLAITILGGDPSVAAAACCIMRLRDLVTMSIGGLWATRRLRPHRLPDAA